MTFKLSNEDKSFVKKAVYLGLPIIAQEFINSLNQFLSFFMVGRSGIEAIAAVGLANQIYFLYALFIFGINSASAIFMGQFWGKGDVRSIHKTLGLSYGLGLFFSGVFILFAQLFPHVIMGFFTSEAPEVVDLGVRFLKIVCFSYIMIAISQANTFALRCVGQTRVPMFSSAMTLIFNAVMCYILIIRMDLGVEGAAYATLLSRVFEVVMQTVLIHALKFPTAASLKEYFSVDLSYIKDYIKTGLPVIVNEMIWASGTVLYMYCYKFTGTDGQGAVQMAASIQVLFSVVGMGIGCGCGILIANALGAGEREMALAYARKCLILTFMVSCVMCLSLIFSADLIISIYGSEVSPEVRALAHSVIMVVAVGIILKNQNYALVVGILRNGGDTRYCLLADAGSVWFVGLPLAYIGARFLHFPVYIVVVLVYCEEISKFFLCFRRMLTNKWAKNIVNEISAESV